MPFQDEATLAAIGLEHVLRAKPTFNQGQRESVEKLPQRIRALLLKFLSGSKAEVEDLPAFDYDEVRELLEGSGEEQARAIYDLLPEPLDDEVAATATRIIAYLQQNLPRRVTRSAVRAKVEAPEPFELGRFERRWLVACDPMIVLRDLAEGSVDPLMVQTLEQLYPDLYQLVLDLVDDAIATMKVKRGENWDVDADQDHALRVLVRADPINAGLVADFQSARQPSKAPAAPKPRAIDAKLTDSERLPSQRS